MKKVRKSIRYPVHEHLEFWVKNTTYTQRLKWLEEAHHFVRQIERLRQSGQLFKRK